MEQYVPIPLDYQSLFHGLSCLPRQKEDPMKVLHIDSSILGDNSASRVLSREIVSSLQAKHSDAEVQYLDLAATALPHMSGRTLAQLDADESAKNAQVLGDFLAADVIVVGAPMYNFSIPTQLKAWIDRVVVAGKTFRYTANGPEGLVTGKRVIVALSRGSVYAAGSPAEFAESYLKHVFGFIGVENVELVRAEGLGLSPEQREKSMNAALTAIRTPVAVAAAA
jgi:FMN-dependent NADH-azoreductase